MLVEFGNASLLNKARQQPDKVRQVIDKIRTDGLFTTIHAVRNKLDQPIPLGYSSSGIVLDIGNGVSGFSVGDRVVSNGPHAEVACVPENLCVRVPLEVSDEEAAFTVISSIGLQGIRLLQPTLGECVTVTGLGLIGLLTVQLLTAQGCRVMGVDFDERKLAMAKELGAEVVNPANGMDPVEAGMAFSRGRGMDGVIITAATSSNDPVTQAARMCRKRGRIVLVGVTGLQLSRADFYEKELSFQVSCSYGPGRYDSSYEQNRQDYPVGFVRWTEQRNFEAVLDMISTGSLNVKPLISHSFSIDNATQAYALLQSDESYLGIILSYSTVDDSRSKQLRELRTVEFDGPTPITSGEPGRAVVGVIGAGNYAGMMLVPALAKTNAKLKTIASSGGISGTHIARKHGFRQTTTDTDSVWSDDELNTLVIATRHDTHANFVQQALKAGKHVFVEKPLAIHRDEITEIRDTLATSESLLMVGFNRRFAPHVQRLKELTQQVSEPKTMIMTVNAGMIPPDHWTQDRNVGGGRIIGEGCHFVDLLRFIADSPIVDAHAMQMGTHPSVAVQQDKMTITLAFGDGSIGTIHYFANGHKSFPKERLEVFCGGRVLQLDNFRVMRGFGWQGFSKMKLSTQDKGHAGCIAAFIQAVESGSPSPIPFDELAEVSQTCIDLVEPAPVR